MSGLRLNPAALARTLAISGVLGGALCCSAGALAFERTLSCDVQGPLQCDPGQIPAPLRWTRRCLDLYFNPTNAEAIGEPADVANAVASAIGSWDSIAESQLRLRYAGTTDENRVGYAVSCNDNINAIMLVTDNWADSPGAQNNVVALTSVTYDFSTGEILDADIEMNLEYFQWELFEAANPLAVEHDLQSTLTHELGHLVGLDHTTDATFSGGADESWQATTMFARTLPGQTAKRTLETDDINGLLEIYGPLTSSPGACPARGPAFRALALSTPGEHCTVENPRGCATSPLNSSRTDGLTLPFGFLLLSLLGTHARTWPRRRR